MKKPDIMRSNARICDERDERIRGGLYWICAAICERLDKLSEVLSDPLPDVEPLPHPPEHGAAEKEAARRLAQWMAGKYADSLQSDPPSTSKASHGLPETIEDALRGLGSLGYTIVSVRPTPGGQWHVSFRGRGDKEVAAASEATVAAAARRVLENVRKRNAERTASKPLGAIEALDRIAAAGWRVTSVMRHSETATSVEMQCSKGLSLFVAETFGAALNKAADFAKRHRAEVK